MQDRGPKPLGPSPLLSQVHEKGIGLEEEQPELEPVVIQNESLLYHSVAPTFTISQMRTLRHGDAEVAQKGGQGLTATI